MQYCNGATLPAPPKYFKSHTVCMELTKILGLSCQFRKFQTDCMELMKILGLGCQFRKLHTVLAYENLRLRLSVS